MKTVLQAASLLLLAGFVSSTEVSQEEIDYYVQALEELNNETLNWIFPTDSSSYLAGNDHWNSNPSKCIFDDHYDFLILGGGSAGTVLANRLSEIPDWKIKILEGGGLENNITNIPGIYNSLVASKFNWGYNSISTPEFGAYIDRSLVFSSGKVIGGSSVINNMFYARGNAEDFNNWARLGNPGWSYSEVLPYFKKSEYVDFQGAELDYHGTDGSLSVQHCPYVNNITKSLLEAQQELGRKILDYNGKEQNGFSVVQLMQINGTRDSGSRAFWAPIQERRNLYTSMNTFILKILIHEKSRRAFGVHYLKDGQCYTAFARKEVILSAGSLSSPQILMVSGIGPREHLKKMGIKVLQDLRVGDNFWNHLIYSTQGYSVNYTYPESDLKEQVAEYLQGNGMLTSPEGLQALGFFNLRNYSEVPDVEYMFASSPPQDLPYEYYEKTYRYTRDMYNYVIQPQNKLTVYYIFVVQMHSKSRGTVRLKSKSPLDFPLLDPNYFQDPEDVNLFIRAFRDMERIANTNAMRKMDAKLINVTLPACQNYTYNSDEFWACMVKNAAQVLHHYGGTCKMGPPTDKTAVVDPELNVYGIKNLRVIDCSVIPVTIAGNTNAAVYMLAEKGADLIKQKYNK